MRTLKEYMEYLRAPISPGTPSKLAGTKEDIIVDSELLDDSLIARTEAVKALASREGSFKTANVSVAKISSGLEALVTSDEFITELSNDIGAPLIHESEEEFVSRAQAKLRDLLIKNFSKL